MAVLAGAVERGDRRTKNLWFDVTTATVRGSSAPTTASATTRPITTTIAIMAPAWRLAGARQQGAWRHVRINAWQLRHQGEDGRVCRCPQVK